MAYELQAILGTNRSLLDWSIQWNYAILVPLEQHLHLVPLTNNLMVWTNGEIVYKESRGSDAINQALKHLGVKKDDPKDEFDTVGLGRKRNTEKWIEIIEEGIRNL